MRCSPCASARRSVLRFEFCEIIGGDASNLVRACSSDASLCGGSILIAILREVLSGHFSGYTAGGGVVRAGVQLDASVEE